MIARRFLIIFVLCYPIVRHGDCILETSSDASSTANSKKNTSNVGGVTTTEIHYATCKIQTEELVADAEATFTRVLTGACNAKIMEERLEKLERSLNERLDEIKGLIASPESRVKSVFSERNRLLGNIVDNDDNKFNSGNNDGRIPPGTSRQVEVQLYNNTVHDDEDGRNVYTYYWQVSNLIEKLLEWDTGRSERSSSFHVGGAGYAMYLRFTPKYFPDGTIFTSAGLTMGHNDSNIIWPFSLPIRIEILDIPRANNGSIKDPSSRLWDPATVCSSYFWRRPRRRRIAGTGSLDNPECVGLRIPRQLLTNLGVEQTASSASSLLTGNYSSNDSLLVKLTVYQL